MRRSATGDSARVTRWTLGRLAVTSSFLQLQVATSLLQALTSFTLLAKNVLQKVSGMRCRKILSRKKRRISGTDGRLGVPSRKVFACFQENSGWKTRHKFR